MKNDLMTVKLEHQKFKNMFSAFVYLRTGINNQTISWTLLRRKHSRRDLTHNSNDCWIDSKMLLAVTITTALHSVRIVSFEGQALN